jgi:hypothetical protein
VSQFDFIASTAPAATPLRNSHEVGDIEHELKQVFLDLFDTLGQDSFDANVLGAAHLGSFELVRRMVNHDGLVLLPGEREEAATRYLYRAWKSGDVQKRGLHFLRTYLELLAPGMFQVTQLWHDKSKPYPTALTGGSTSQASWWLRQIGEPGLTLSGNWGVGRWISDPVELEERKSNSGRGTEGLWLTSRIEISADIGSVPPSIASLLPIFQSIIPARLSPDIVMWLAVLVLVLIQADATIETDKSIEARYPWDRTLITSDELSIVKIGLDDSYTTLPATFGAFRVGHADGGKAHWQVGSRVVVTDMQTDVDVEVGFWQAETLPPTPEPLFTAPPVRLAIAYRQVDGEWGVGGALRLGSFGLDGRRMPTRKMYATPKIGRFKIHSNQRPYIPQGVARLKVDGAWHLSGVIAPVITISHERGFST